LRATAIIIIIIISLPKPLLLSACCLSADFRTARRACLQSWRIAEPFFNAGMYALWPVDPDELRGK